jgi:hypothetical protein
LGPRAGISVKQPWDVRFARLQRHSATYDQAAVGTGVERDTARQERQGSKGGKGVHRSLNNIRLLYIKSGFFCLWKTLTLDVQKAYI